MSLSHIYIYEKHSNDLIAFVPLHHSEIVLETYLSSPCLIYFKYNPQNEALHFFKSKRHFLQNETVIRCYPPLTKYKKKQGSLF